MVGKRVYVEGHGEGAVQAFEKLAAVSGPSSHTIAFDDCTSHSSGGTAAPTPTAVKLSRKHNLETPWLLHNDEVAVQVNSAPSPSCAADSPKDGAGAAATNTPGSLLEPGSELASETEQQSPVLVHTQWWMATYFSKLSGLW